MELEILAKLLEQQQRPEFVILRSQFQRACSEKDIIALEALYQQVIRFYETAIWEDGSPSDEALQTYQKLFREMEQIIAAGEDDGRAHFVVVISVHDNPLQLQSCLQSLYSQVLLYHYGGVADGVFAKVSVLISDDSLTAENTKRHAELAKEYSALGLRSEYFGRLQQTELKSQLPEIFSDEVRQPNITLLKLSRLAENINNPLFFFVDSANEFLVSIRDRQNERTVAAINYFYYLDHLFREKTLQVLSSKVVGALPVSPVSMITHFLADAIAFLQQLLKHPLGHRCIFHQP